MKSKTYQSSKAFRIALEQRLKNYAFEKDVDLQEIRRKVAFERFLCRLFRDKDSHWVLKGGYAMELRISQARATRDIDLVMRKANLRPDFWDDKGQEMLKLLRHYSAFDMGDFFECMIGEPMYDLENAPFGGCRYPIDAQVDGRSFVKFHIDVSSGDNVEEPFEYLSGEDWLAFANIFAMQFPSISKEEQFSEKLHAYTLSRGDRENSRVRDLIDMVLLIDQGSIDKAKLLNCIQKTFRIRNTHQIPERLSVPPVFWRIPFAEIAISCQIEPSIDVQFEKLHAFFLEIHQPQLI